ncbi:nuclear receptor corepressor 1 [Caerostris extrusa]|uniref:Nuclear receptor corepressor 1 n=1 Tax=Caerostris extrusa TaxID=172846 RepID=A0AAV4SWM2_CAEEX|nr:nuclear receptor corepressor 1 [Caerostris extrusa]
MFPISNLFTVDTRAPTEPHHLDNRYGDHNVQHARRRLSLRPAPAAEYTIALERRGEAYFSFLSIWYIDAYRYQYEREVALGVSYASNAMAARTLKPPVVSVHTPPEMDNTQPMKRPRLAVEPKAPEPAYTPQVEAISPTLPSEEGRCESPMKTLKENILASINRLEKEITQIECQDELEAEARKPSVAKETVKDVCPFESKQMSIAQIIYSENKNKAEESHAVLEKLGPKVQIPMYNQPCDTAVYYENKRKFHLFRNRLVKCFKKRHRERELREKHLTDTYSKFMQEWKTFNRFLISRAKDAKLREFFEKQFPELKKQREDKERISRVSTRVRSECELEEIIDGLQEQELEEKKMRSYAVIPPILLDSRQRRLWYMNNNGVIEDLSQECKERQLLNIWTLPEKELFREKYLQHPKNFALIATCLERKSVADCVQYYYLSKKSENYKQLLRKHNVRKRTRALGKPQQNQQQQQVSQTTGVTTRQQEDAKASSFVSSCSTSLPSNLKQPHKHPLIVIHLRHQSPQPILHLRTVLHLHPTTVPQLLLRKKEAVLKMGEKEDARSDSDTASDHQNDSNPAQPCAVCKMELDNYNQSRALTKSNCSTFGIKESDLVNGMRVCASCRFKTVRKRIVRKLDNNSTGDPESCENIKWTDSETDLIKQGLSQHGTDWESVASVVSTKSKEQCRQFFFSYKRKMGLDDIVHEFKKSKRYKESMQQDGKPPPIVTDEEESGETTSSCDEDDRADRCSSDTASAPSPVDKILNEDKSESSRTQENISETSQPVSADEGQNDGRDLSPRVIHSHPLKIGGERKHFQSPLPIPKDEIRTPDSSIPILKASNQDPKEPRRDDSPPFIQAPKKEEPTCVRDLIYQAIEMSLGSQWPSSKPGRNSSPIPTSVSVPMKTESPDITIVEPKRKWMHPWSPPPAHSNHYRSTQHPPPALSPHYVAEPHHELYYPRGGDPRGKSYLVPERPHSQPPHLVAQSSSLPNNSSMTLHAKPVPIKTTVPPPPPLVASKPSQMSPKVPFKDRIVSIPPSGSITQGTPVNQQSIPVPPTNLSSSRYEGLIRQLPTPQTKEGGSITLGTPVQHDSVKRIPNSRPEAFSQTLSDNIIRQAVPAMYDPSVMEYYRQVAPGAQQYAFAAGYPPYPSNITPQRPPYANESQLSTKQIIIDFNTSKQMQMRRGGNVPSEKELKVSPRGSDSNSSQVLPQENHLHPMYPPTNYQGSGGPHYNHVPSSYQPTDSRYIHHRPQNTQIDRTRSPSGVESPLNASYAQHPGKRSPSLALGSGRQNVIQNVHRSITWGTAKPSVIQAPQSASARTPDMRTETISPANVRKSTPSPRHPQPILYPSVPNSGHESGNLHTLANAASIQLSLTVPKDGKGSPTSNVHSRQDAKSPRDRPVVEGLEKTLIDMHQRPRSYAESGNSHERVRNNNSTPPEQLNDGHRYQGFMHNSYDLSREQRMAEKQMLINDQPSTLRLGNMREPFSREQFERQMRQTNVSASRDRVYGKKEEERCRSGSSESQTPNYPSPSPQQSDLENEANLASKIFSQSFQKDVPKSNSSPRGFTAANLIDAIITRQINHPDNPAVALQNTKTSGMDIFGQYHSGYEGSKTPPKSNIKLCPKTEVVTIDDEPENEKTWPEKSNTHGRSPPVSSNNSTSNPSDKVYTLSEHIAAIISKDYNSPSDASQAQPLFSNSQSSVSTTVSTPTRSSFVLASNNSSGKPLEGIASALPTEAVLVNSNTSHGVPDHSPQNCPGNGCSYHTHSWKLRRALQQDRDREHRSPGLNENSQKRPSSNQSCDVPQEERQIIRVAQTSSPSSVLSTRASPTGPYGVEPISPPSQSNEPTETSNRLPSSNSQPPAWANNPGITGLLTTRHMYPQEYPEGVPPPIPHYNVPTTVGSSSSGGPNRPPHQQQMGLSPLDYVKNRIVEVMRTADNEQEVPESRRPQSAMGYSDERDHSLQHVYRYQPGADRDISAERPCSTGNGPPVLQGQRYSPAVTRYSPVPPRPSSAAERVPSRNSTPGEVPRSLKRGSDGHLISGDWRDSPSVSSRASSRSVSPNNVDHPDNVSRKKTRSEGTFIPESTTDRAPVLLPQNSISVHRSGSLSEAPRLSSNNPSPQIVDGQSASKGIVSPRMDPYSQTESEYKFRMSDNRPESQWSLMNNHNRTAESESLARLSESMNMGAASSTTAESFSPSNRTDMPLKTEPGPRQSPVTGSGSQEPNRNSPSASSQGQRSATSTPMGMNVSSSSGLYPPFGAINGSVSSSTNAMFSSATTLPPPASPHVAYSFSGMGNTYAYPFSALSMRSLSTTHNSTSLTNSSSSVSSSHMSTMPVNNSSSNSPSPLHRNNQPPPLLSSQYEPLSDED